MAVRVGGEGGLRLEAPAHLGHVAVARGDDDAMHVSRIPIPEMPPELKQVIEDQKQ